MVRQVQGGTAVTETARADTADLSTGNTKTLRIEH